MLQDVSFIIYFARLKTLWPKKNLKPLYVIKLFYDGNKLSLTIPDISMRSNYKVFIAYVVKIKIK